MARVRVERRSSVTLRRLISKLLNLEALVARSRAALATDASLTGRKPERLECGR